jgi:capsular polysaccharide biosynthesis protein
MELIEYIRIIKKRLWFIALLVVLAVAASGYYSYYMVQPVYQASTDMIVSKTENGPNGQPVLDYTSVVMNLMLLDTYKEIIKTGKLMKTVAEQHPELGMSPQQLNGAVRISSAEKSQVMTISAVDASYDRAVDIVNAVAQTVVQEIPKIMKVDNVTILSPADKSDPAMQIAPRPVLTMAVSMIVALMFSIAAVFFYEYVKKASKSTPKTSKPNYAA